MKRYLWKVKELSSQAKDIAKKCNISVFLAQVFINRDIQEVDFASFLNPTSADFHCPLLLPDIKKASDRIKSAVKHKEKVLVFGDYDVDGITSLAIFYEFSRGFPEIFSFYIPHRIEEGYGLNKEAVLEAKKRGVSLIIAFDCGTNAHEEVELAGSLGIDVIVVDHHYPKDDLNKPFAFINPQRKDSQYPFSDLSAAALSFKLLQVLTDSGCQSVLDLVILSLVCDVSPLKGENRALVKEGLRVLKKSKRLSIKALCKVSGIKQENISIFHIGYILGPRINASGRMAHAEHSLGLFFAKNETEAYNLALKLDEYNRLRRDVEAQILKEAELIVKDNAADDRAIVVSGDKWHPGVLGIVASRLSGKYYRPSFVISFDQDVGVGSGRSTQEIHLMETLDKCADSLLLYGGHGKAAGVHISRNELENFKEKINFYIKDNFDSQDFIPTLDVDVSLDFESITTGFVEDLERVEPYGEGNPEPLFAAYGIFKKSSPKKIRAGFSLWLSNQGRVFEGIVYDKNVLEIINYFDSFDIVFSLKKNNYHNIPKLVIKDCKAN